MRKLLLSLGCALFMAGLVLADQYTVSSPLKDGSIGLKDKDGKEVTAKVNASTKVKIKGKDGDKDGTVDGLSKMLGSDKAVGRKVEATIKDGAVTEITVGGGKGKKN